jgi:FMN phosphatase YigB (HAD superfamily)
LIRAILFDLDGTLLPMDMEEFLKNYLELLSNKLNSYLEPMTFINELMAATSAMIMDKNYQKCNAEVFAEAFFTATGLDEGELMPVFEDFYLNEYCLIGQDLKPVPIVKEIIDIVKEKGYRLVLATNPLFPLIAVQERIKWAGINPDVFSLITSYENMHATKPNPQYYKEISQRIGMEPEYCLMVGNDVEEDLVAKTIGMQTFLVKDHILNRKNLPIITDYEGNLHDLLVFAKNLEPIA